MFKAMAAILLTAGIVVGISLAGRGGVWLIMGGILIILNVAVMRSILRAS